jgi:hypothetical protein
MNYRILTADGRIKFAGTDQPSWLSRVKAAIAADTRNGEMICEYDRRCELLWELFPGYPVFIDKYSEEPDRFHVWYRSNTVDVYKVPTFGDLEDINARELLFVEDEQTITWGSAIDLYVIVSHDFNAPAMFQGIEWDGGDAEEFRKLVKFAEANGYTKIEMDFSPCMGEMQE